MVQTDVGIYRWSYSAFTCSMPYCARNEYIAQNGYENDITESRLHHEIYLSDARKVAPEKWKTVIRHPIKRSRQQP